MVGQVSNLHILGPGTAPTSRQAWTHVRAGERQQWQLGGGKHNTDQALGSAHDIYTVLPVGQERDPRDLMPESFKFSDGDRK